MPFSPITPAPTYSSPTFSTSTNLGPITTTLSFPQDCYTNLYDFQTWGLGFPWSYVTAGCAKSSCCPSGNYYSQEFAWMTTYYSPGLYCPSNYQTCPPPLSPYALPSTSGEYIFFCCPSKYGCPAWTTQSGRGMIYDGCNSGFSVGSEVVTVENNIYDQNSISEFTSTVNPSTTMWQIAWPIQIRWHISDFLPSTTSTIPKSTSMPTASAPATSTSTRFSGGAVAGISIGVLFAFILLLGFPVFFCLWRRRRLASAPALNYQPSLLPEVVPTTNIPGQTGVPMVSKDAPVDVAPHNYPLRELEGNGV